MTITVQPYKIGAPCIWREGKSKSKKVLPMGIANCIIRDVGTGPNGTPCVKIELPEPFAQNLPVGLENPFWVVAADIEA
jgi:hypothetical protein